MNEAPSSMAPRKPRRSGVVVPHQARWFERLAARLIWFLVRSFGATLRVRLHDGSGFFTRETLPPQPIIFCIWHNRLSLCLELYRLFVQRRQPKRKMAAMVSASRDGGFLAHALKLFKVHPVRGSSSRRGSQALLEMVSWAEKGYDLAVTPDGPRGPRYRVQEGVIALGQLTGLPIVPASYRLAWKRCLKSWDQFQFPLPFTRCEIEVAEPIRVPRECSDDEREKFRQLLEDRLKAITRD